MCVCEGGGGLGVVFFLFSGLFVLFCFGVVVLLLLFFCVVLFGFLGGGGLFSGLKSLMQK